MPWQKRIADIFTLSRVPLGLALIWLGMAHGRSGVEIALLLLLAAATVDTLDGYFARLAPGHHQTWIGANDLLFDLLFSTALLLYLALSGYVSALLSTAYLGVWVALLASQQQIANLPSVVFQAPIYLKTIWVAGAANARIFAWVAGWLAVMLVFAGHRFVHVRLPAFAHNLFDSLSGVARWRR